VIPGPGRFRRTAAAMLALCAVSACSGDGEAAARPGETVSDPATAPPGVCADPAPANCFRVDSGQWVSVRPGNGAGFVLLDMGGPGSAPTDTDQVESSLPAWAKSHSVVKVFEPWVGQELTATCKRYFAEVSWSAAGDRSPGGCVDFVSDWAQPDLNQLVSEISRRIGQELAGIVTFSFGSTRTRPVWPLLGPDGFLLAVQPAPTPAVSTARIAELRAEAAWAALSDVRRQTCADGAACLSLADLRERLGRAGATGSWPAPGTEVGLFVMGAVADRDRYARLLGKLFDGSAFGPADAADVHRVAMSFTHSLGPEQGLDSNAGFRAEICQAYGAADANSSDDPLARAFLAQTGPCGDSTRTYPAPGPAPPARSCVLTSDHDPVVPPGLLDAVAAFGPDRSLGYPATGHVWPADVVPRVRFESAGAAYRCVLDG
jgi:hypothetical protein